MRRMRASLADLHRQAELIRAELPDQPPGCPRSPRTGHRGNIAYWTGETGDAAETSL